METHLTLKMKFKHYTKKQIHECMFDYMDNYIQLSYNAHKTICNIIEYMVNRLYNYLKDTPLVEQEIINAFMFSILNIDNNYLRRTNFTKRARRYTIKRACILHIQNIQRNNYGLQLPILPMIQILKSKGLNIDIDIDERPIIVELITGGIEYLLSEIIKKSCSVARNKDRITLMSSDIDEGIKNNKELRKIFME